MTKTPDTPVVTSEGFLLAARDFRKSDKLLLILTYDLGYRFGILAKKRSGLIDGLEFPSAAVYPIGYVDKPGTPFVLVKEIGPAKDTARPKKINKASDALRNTVPIFLAKLTPDFAEGDIIFTLAFYTLKRMDETGRYAEFLAYFLVKYITQLGSMPRMGACFSCNDDLHQTESFFHFERLRLLCSDCHSKESPRIATPGTITHLGSDIVRILTLIAERDPSVIGRLKITERQYAELGTFLVRLAERQLG